MRRSIEVIAIACLASWYFYGVPVLSQQTPVVRQPVSGPQLISMLLRTVATPVLDPDSNSKMTIRTSASLLRQYQASAKLSDKDLSIILDMAVNYSTQVAELDQKARKIIEVSRADAKKKGGPLPPPPPELAELQAQRDSVLEQTVSRLRDALGTDAYERLVYVLSHRNVNDRGEDRSSMSVSLPRELAMPAPPESRVTRPDFIVPRESLYESKLPVKMMITPVGPDGGAEKLRYSPGEYVYLKVTLLNTVRERQALHVADVLSNYHVTIRKNGQRIPDLMLNVPLTLLPALAGSPVIDIPFDSPMVIGTLRPEKNQHYDLSEGEYAFVLQRDFALRPTINKEEEKLYEEIGHFAIKSNTVSITIQK